MSFGMRNRRATRTAPAPSSTTSFAGMNPDIAFLPPIETIDLDKAKDFEKEQIRTYLEFYEIEPATTKPDMKKQLKMLVNAIKNGSVPRKPVPGIVTAEAATVATVAAPVFQPAPPNTTATPMPEKVDFATLPDIAIDIYIPARLDDFMPPPAIAMSDSMYPGIPGMMGLGPKITMPSAEALVEELMPRLEKETIEAVCVQCGKRANRDCKFDRCKNCCVTGKYACKEHARYQPGGVMGTVEESPEMEKRRKEEEAVRKAEEAGIDPATAIAMMYQEEAAAAAAAAAEKEAAEPKKEGEEGAATGDTAAVDATKPEDQMEVDKPEPVPQFAALPEETLLQQTLLNQVVSGAQPVGVDLAAEPGFEGADSGTPISKALNEAKERVLANLAAMQDIFSSSQIASVSAAIAALRAPQQEDGDVEFLEWMRSKMRKIEEENEKNIVEHKHVFVTLEDRAAKSDELIKAAGGPNPKFSELRASLQEIFPGVVSSSGAAEEHDHQVVGYPAVALKKIPKPAQGRQYDEAPRYLTVNSSL